MISVKEEAARWFVKMQHAEPDDPRRSLLEAWLLESPAHAHAYAAMEKLWVRFDSGSELEALANVLEQQKEHKLQARRRVLKGTVLGLLFSGGLGSLAYRQWQTYPLWELARQTAIGQLYDQPLQDGSQLTLGANSQIQVAFSRAERRIKLMHGEVIFDVARDEQHPFIIDSDIAKITVLGTRFVVSRFNDLVRVSVERGKVEVASGRFWNRQKLVITAGEVAEVTQTEDGPTSPNKTSRDADDAFGFSKGTLVFTKVSLNELAETLSRYRRQPVRVISGSQNGPPITAVVHTRDIDGFLQILPQICPVTVVDQGSQTLLGAVRR